MCFLLCIHADFKLIESCRLFLASFWHHIGYFNHLFKWASISKFDQFYHSYLQWVDGKVIFFHCQTTNKSRAVAPEYDGSCDANRQAENPARALHWATGYPKSQERIKHSKSWLKNTFSPVCFLKIAVIETFYWKNTYTN